MKKISFKNPNELKVGIFILVPVIMLLIFIALKLGYSLSTSTIDVYLKIDNISAIKKGTAIKLKGYDIGRVVELRPVYKPGLHFLATMRINKDIDLHEDCAAIILNQNIIGDTVVEMRNPEGKGSPLRNGDVIEGLEYVNLEAILKDVHNLLVNVTDTVTVVKGITSDSRQNIKGLPTNLESSLVSVNSILLDAGKEVPEILASLRDTMKVANEISLEFQKRPMGFILSGEENENKPVEKSKSENVKPVTE